MIMWGEDGMEGSLETIDEGGYDSIHTSAVLKNETVVLLVGGRVHANP